MWLINDARNFDECALFFKDAMIVGNINHLTFKRLITPLSLYYGLFDGENLMGYYWLLKWEKLPLTYKGHEFHVRDELQKQGIGSLLYEFILFEEGFAVMSDHLHTQLSSRMWDKFSIDSRLDIGMYDELTNKIEWRFDKEVVYGNDNMHFIVRAR
jgi:hypothetical protein